MVTTKNPGTWIQTWANPRSIQIAASLNLGEAMKSALGYVLEPEEAERRLRIFGENLILLQLPLEEAVAATFEGTPSGVQLLGQTSFWKGLDATLGCPGEKVDRNEE